MVDPEGQCTLTGRLAQGHAGSNGGDESKIEINEDFTSIKWWVQVPSTGEWRYYWTLSRIDDPSLISPKLK
jgi:hypothetical protein